MAKNKKITKAAKLKLIKALDTLLKFSSNTAERDLSESAVQHILNITETYRIKNDGSNISFNLVFLTPGVGAVTSAKLNDPVASTNTSIIENATDSINNKLIGTDTQVARKFFELRSNIVATNLTPVPANFEAVFTITGGTETVTFLIPTQASFKEVGDEIVLDVSIFIF